MYTLSILSVGFALGIAYRPVRDALRLDRAQFECKHLERKLSAGRRSLKPAETYFAQPVVARIRSELNIAEQYLADARKKITEGHEQAARPDLQYARQCLDTAYGYLKGMPKDRKAND